jgi:hypothetical protein
MKKDFKKKEGPKNRVVLKLTLFVLFIMSSILRSGMKVDPIQIQLKNTEIIIVGLPAEI